MTSVCTPEASDDPLNQLDYFLGQGHPQPTKKKNNPPQKFFLFKTKNKKVGWSTNPPFFFKSKIQKDRLLKSSIKGRNRQLLYIQDNILFYLLWFIFRLKTVENLCLFLLSSWFCIRTFKTRKISIIRLYIISLLYRLFGRSLAQQNKCFQSRRISKVNYKYLSHNTISWPKKNTQILLLYKKQKIKPKS